MNEKGRYRDKFWSLFGIIFLFIGLIFFVIGLAFLMLHPYATGEDKQALMIIGSVFSFIGIIFTIIGVVSLMTARRNQKKMERLVYEGICYDGEIVRMYENHYMSINSRHPFVVECVYKDKYGRSNLVKSGNIWPDRFFIKENGIKAKVWVNRDDPRDYYVEVLFDSDNENLEHVYDYR